jgi:hypothetical protein
MGFFDKIKKFAGGKNMATVEVTAIGDQPPAGAVIAISDDVVRGAMRTTIQQECVLLQTKYEVILRTQDDQGQWGSTTVASGTDVARRELTPGQVIDQAWRVADVDIEHALRGRGFADMNAVLGNPKVKLLVNCIADVEGSPFDPNAEVEVRLGPSTASPVTIRTTTIERQPAADASFKLTDSILKGTVVVTGRSACVLAATRYEVRLELETPAGHADVLLGQAQTPELKPNPFSASFGGTNISFPLKVDHGAKATQTWMVKDLDLRATLAAHGFSDADAAIADPRVKLVVRCLADLQGWPGAAADRTEVRLTN